MEQRSAPDAHTLSRTLGFTDLVLIVIGTVIGSGIFIVPATVLAQSGGALGTSLLVWLIAGVLVLGLAFALGIVMAMVGAPTRLTEMITQLVMVPLFPLIGVAVTLLYYDLRVRADGADVAAMIDALPATPAQSA